MILNKKSEYIDKEFILEKITEYDIFRYYMPVPFTVGDKCRSPFTKQKTGSFGIFKSREHNRLFYQDFDPEQSQYRGDCINFVMQYLGISNINDALEQIAKDFGLIDGTDKYKEIKKQYVQPILDNRLSTLIHVQAKAYDKKALAYWNRWNIDLEQLKRERIYNVDKWWLNRRRQLEVPGELCFAYWFPTGFKILRPDRPADEKWRNNVGKIVENIDYVRNYDRVVITKSRKDRLVLTNCLPKEILVVNTQNETIGCFPDDLIPLLAGKKVWIAFDTDSPGKEASRELQKKIEGSLHINVPDQFLEEQGIKDWADLYEEYGKYPIVEHFKKKRVLQ